MYKDESLLFTSTISTLINLQVIVAMTLGPRIESLLQVRCYLEQIWVLIYTGSKVGRLTLSPGAVTITCSTS